MNNYPGKLIVLYGINNLGKSTQARLLVEKMKDKGYQAEYLKYPIYDLMPSGTVLNNYLREKNSFGLSAREAQIIYSLNRTQYQDILIAKLKSGLNIVAEDYVGTGLAWGLGAGVDENFLKEINSHLIKEDLVFLFDGERFKEATENGHKHETDDDLLNKVRWAHLKLREEYGWRKISANLAIEEIHEQLWTEVNKLLEGRLTEKETEIIPPKNALAGFQPIGEIIGTNHKDLKINDEKTETKNETTETKEPALSSLSVSRVRPGARLPQIAHEGDAGYDLYAADYYSIPPYGQALVASGIKMAIPQGHVGLIWDKSGLAVMGIKTMGGVIDSGYRGEIMIVVKNLSEEIFNITPGQKVAQIIIQPFISPAIKEEDIKEETDRQAKGFGSSGQF